jgi:hypothetical protein
VNACLAAASLKRSKIFKKQEVQSNPDLEMDTQPSDDLSVNIFDQKTKVKKKQNTVHRELLRAHRKSFVNLMHELFGKKMYCWTNSTRRDVCRFLFTGHHRLPTTMRLCKHVAQVYKFSTSEFEEHEAVFFSLLYKTLRDFGSNGIAEDPFTTVMDLAVQNTPKNETMKQYLEHPIIA